MKPSCSSCAHAFREEWSRDTDALLLQDTGQGRRNAHRRGRTAFP